MNTNCSCHLFIVGAPSVDPCHPDYVPSMFAHKNTTTDGSQKLERYQRSQRRSSVVEPMDSPSLEVTQADSEEGCTAVGTDLSMADIDQLQNENIELKRKNGFSGEETGVSRKTTTRSYVWQSIRFYFK